MSKVLTFSRTFPAHHPKKGQPTFFVEKVLNGLTEMQFDFDSGNVPAWTNEFSESISNLRTETKFHTIRAGNRFKVGDKFSPRCWSGKPYCSPQIIIAPDITIEKVWDFKMIAINEKGWGFGIYVEIDGKPQNIPTALHENDGLKMDELIDWFNVKIGKPFTGQIICWNSSINY